MLASPLVKYRFLSPNLYYPLTGLFLAKPWRIQSHEIADCNRVFIYEMKIELFTFLFVINIHKRHARGRNWKHKSYCCKVEKDSPQPSQKQDRNVNENVGMEVVWEKFKGDRNLIGSIDLINNPQSEMGLAQGLLPPNFCLLSVSFLLSVSLSLSLFNYSYPGFDTCLQ